MSSIERRIRLITRLHEMGFSYEEAQSLRRIEMTLSRWGELECGDGNDYGSWAIERDEDTDKPYMVHHHYRHGNGQDTISRHVIPDREKGALKRLDKIIGDRNNRYSRESGDPAGHIRAYHQGDPRGCCLYLITEGDLNGSDINSTYTRGLAVCD